MPSTPPLTPTQQQILVLHSLLPSSNVLTMSYALLISGPLRVDAARRSLQEIVWRHEIFRSAPWGSPAGMRESSEATFRVAYTSAREEGARWDEAMRIVTNEMRGPVSSNDGALIRAILIGLGADQHILVVAMHHLCADQWSLELLGRQWSQYYSAIVHESEPPVSSWMLAGSPGPSGDGADAHTAREQSEWWNRYLEGVTASTLSLPLDHPRLPVPYLRTSRLVLPLADDLVRRVQATARRAGVTFFTILLAAFEVVLGRWTACFDVVVGTLAANRTGPETSHRLGAFYHPILIRTNLEGDPTLATILERTAESGLAALERQGVPFPQIARGLHRRLGVRLDAMPAAMFLVDRFPLQRLTFEGAETRPINPVRLGGDGSSPIRRMLTVTAADITFFVREQSANHSLSIFYKTDLLELRTVRHLAQGFVKALDVIVRQPEVALSKVELPP